MNDDLSFWKLRLDLLAFCRRFQMPDGMFTTPEAWHRFALPSRLKSPAVRSPFVPTTAAQ